MGPPPRFQPVPPQPLAQPSSPAINFAPPPAAPGIIVQRGIFATTFAATNSQAGSVTFPFPFPPSQPSPVVILTIEVGGNLDVNINVQSRSLTGFNWRWFQNTGANITGNLTIHWAAYSAVP